MVDQNLLERLWSTVDDFEMPHESQHDDKHDYDVFAFHFQESRRDDTTHSARDWPMFRRATLSNEVNRHLHLIFWCWKVDKNIRGDCFKEWGKQDRLIDCKILRKVPLATRRISAWSWGQNRLWTITKSSKIKLRSPCQPAPTHEVDDQDLAQQNAEVQAIHGRWVIWQAFVSSYGHTSSLAWGCFDYAGACCQTLWLQ